jgi:uncharacterized protein HemX
MRRATVLLALLLALAAPAAALAQNSDFGPLPPAVTPSPAPTATPKSVADQSSVSRPLLLGIAAVVALLFLGIGMYISRDARRNLTDEDRRALERAEKPITPADRRKAEQARKKARAKTRAQKQARKKGRR